VLDLPRDDGGAALEQDRPDGARIRVVVTTDRTVPMISVVRAVRNAAVTAASVAPGHVAAEVTVRIVAID